MPTIAHVASWLATAERISIMVADMKTPVNIQGILAITIIILLALANVIQYENVSFAQQQALPSYTIIRENRWYGRDADEFPCAIEESAYPEIWHNEEYAGGSNRYDVLVVDWQARQLWQIYQDEPRSYALVWQTFELGEDEQPHPAGSWFLDCDG